MKVLKKKELFNKYLIDVIVLLILFSSCSSTIITGKYPYTKRLNNGNYVIASSRNITFTDSSLSTSLNSLNFDSDIIKSEDNGLGSTSIAQFPAEQNGYVLVILNKILFVFSSTGVHLVNQNTTIKNTKFPAYLITNGNSGSNYYFTLIYCDHETNPTSEDCTYIAFIKYTYNSSTKSLTSEKKDYDPPINTFFGTISCSQMSNSNSDYIACAYGEYQHIYVSVFDPNDNYNLVYSADKELYSQFVKATVLLPERNNLLICSYAQGNGKLNCFYYNIGDNSLSSDPLQLENTCGGQPISLTIEYFYETESFIVGCKLDGNTLTLNEISKELTLKTNFGTTYDNTNLFSGAEDVGRISIIFPQGGNQFTVYYNLGQSCNSNCPENVMTRIGNEISSSNLHPYPTTEVSPLVCDAYYSYDGKTCINDIPEGFYCNSTNDKTIDKCHDNCKSCTTGPTSTNNSCTTCKDTVTIYYDLGNCVSECTNGHFTENSIMKCKCSSDISCEYCSVESKAQNLCVTCNKNYYPKKEDPENRDSFIKCYNDSTISSGYYLNTNIYEPCHTNCLKCSGAGTDNDNKCTICNDGLTLIKNKLNIINCYTTCTNYYYFDNGNNYHCTTELKCPDNYKLINVKGKCIDNCEYDDTYKFEYNGDCYNECPPNTINSSSNTYICELNCKHFNKYFNLERTACIQNIEEGYYCDNEDLNTIAQCHTNCKTCTKGPTDSNNNCETCKETGTIYFDLGNCRDNCKNGDFTENGIKKCKCTSDEKCYYCSDESKALGLCESCNTESGYYKKKDDDSNQLTFINCYKDKPLNHYLNTLNEQFEPCHENCMSCEEGPTETQDNCKECKSGYSFIKNNNYITNCYQDCTKKYYFDSSNNFICDDECPSTYKLITNTNKCIDNCMHDNIYNSTFELDGVCYKECPSTAHISDEENRICEADLTCNGDEYFNYERTGCISDIPIGFYCDNQELRTIAQCHTNCKRCDRGPTENNNNCIECKDSKYFYLGNCLDGCTHGNYEEDSILKCTCEENIECKECTGQSNSLQLCKSCNIQKGYYPKSDEEERDDGFIKCYKNPEKYFLDNEKYYPCYETCLSCDELGDGTNNKCTSCLPTHLKKHDFEDDDNCYEICGHYYYYDSDKKHYCTDEDQCPPNYKLISTKRKCIDDCTKDDNDKFEYNGACVSSCPSNTHINDDNPNKCIDNLYCELNNKYYNYEGAECIDDIPEGFYCNNPTEWTVAPCHTNCKACDKGPTSDNNNCKTCKDEGTIYFDLGNCRDSCVNGNFIEDTVKKCKCSTDIRCQFCNETSKEINKCIGCNYVMGYYPKSDDNTNNFPYINCYKDPENYYLNEQIYEPCYISCKFCSSLGNETENNCLECRSTYEKKNDFENDNNCYEKCPYYYYYDDNRIYHCTTESKCPENYNKLIQSKNRCINYCKNDNKYKYEYENNCFEICPKGTKESKNDKYLCEIIEIENEDNCELKEYKLKLSSKQEISLEYLNFLAKEYIGLPPLKDYVSKYENNNYIVYLYKNLECVERKVSEAPIPNFGDSYDKVKRYYNVSEDEDLIYAIVKEKDNKGKNIPSNGQSVSVYNLINPQTCEVLNISEVCGDDKIEVQEDVLSKLVTSEEKKEYIKYLTSQGIDIFNISDRFYNDLCFHFESPNGRDVPMKDRIKEFFPNMTLCEPGCDSKGVDLDKLKAKCECTFNKLMNNNLMDNFYGQTIAEFMGILNSLNINVVQCIKDIFDKEQISKCVGGFIILALLSGQLVCMIKYIIDGLYVIRKYIFSLTESFNIFMKKNIIKEPKKKKKGRQSQFNHVSKLDNNSVQSSSNMIISNHGSNKDIKKKTVSPKTNLLLDDKKVLKKNKIKINEKIQTNNIGDDEYMSKIKEFLAPSFDENDFDDVISKDKRTFCQFFCEKFQNNQIFINAFCIKEILRPRALKSLILIMTIELYFVINALFYNEEYLSNLFNSKEEDTFFSFIPRRINEYIYTSAVSGIISYLIGYFFIEEVKLKRIFSRNKLNEAKLKYELSVLANNIQQRFLGLIILSISLSIICFVYISCFNIVYPYIREEWLKSSSFILILMQVINFFISLIESCIRYLSIKCNSKKIFRLSLLFS